MKEVILITVVKNVGAKQVTRSDVGVLHQIEHYLLEDGGGECTGTLQDRQPEFVRECDARYAQAIAVPRLKGRLICNSRRQIGLESIILKWHGIRREIRNGSCNVKIIRSNFSQIVSCSMEGQYLLSALQMVDCADSNLSQSMFRERNVLVSDCCSA